MMTMWGLTRGLTRWRSFFPDDIPASEPDELFAALIRKPCSDWYVAAGREVRIRTCNLLSFSPVILWKTIRG